MTFLHRPCACRKNENETPSLPPRAPVDERDGVWFVLHRSEQAIAWSNDNDQLYASRYEAFEQTIIGFI